MLLAVKAMPAIITTLLTHLVSQIRFLLWKVNLVRPNNELILALNEAYVRQSIRGVVLKGQTSHADKC